MTKPSIKIIAIVFAISFGSYYLYNNFLYKKARNINEEKPLFSFSALNLSNQYKTDTSKADSKYLNKTMEIEGKVTEVTDSTLVLDRKIFCKMNEKMTPNFMNKQVNIKGRCIGYDDLFEVVKFDQCNKQ
jgi:hypothetical protein